MCRSRSSIKHVLLRKKTPSFSKDLTQSLRDGKKPNGKGFGTQQETEDAN